MTYPTQLKAAPFSPLISTEHFQSSPHPASGFRTIFIGPNGLRAGWRLLIFAVLIVVLVGGFLIVRSGGVQGFREAQKHAGEVIVTPLLMGWSEGMAFVLTCVATLIMGKIERRKFNEYGLPLRLAFGKDFWRGCLWGFLAISGTLLAMFLLHGFRITGVALHGPAAFAAAIEWGIAFAIVGMCEEFLLRGYFQYALSSGIGFWPAAFVMAGMFAFSHSFNANETPSGVVATGLFSLLFCLFLRRTGNLWIPVGFHAAWNWGQTLYGVSDSGIAPYHSVFHSASTGPQWLTGGIVGPEASIFCPLALLVVGVIFSRYYRQNRYQTSAT
jgi:membrane protease YdiL (CAAX protease family)